MATKNETKDIKKITTFLKKLGFSTQKNAPGYFSVSGEPDLFVHGFNLKIAIEVKTFKKNSRLKEQQKLRLYQYQTQGYYTYVINNEASFQAFCDDIRNYLTKNFKGVIC